jgi:hypothetical protein
VCRACPVEGYYDTCWLTGLWSSHAKVECIVLKAARYWSSNSSVINDPLGETKLHPVVCTPSVCVGLCGR